MRKRIFVLLAIMLFMVACGSVEYDGINYETYETSNSVKTEVHSPSLPASTPISVSSQREDVGTPTISHPFAMALKDYMSNSHGIVRAYLATLDDEGTLGVLITTEFTTMILFDYEEREYVYGGLGTLFYIQDGELLQINAPGFVSGWYNRLVQRFYTHTHLVEIIYKLEDGRFEASTRLEYFSDGYLLYFSDSVDVAERHMAERDARAEYAREKYGLVALLPPNFGHMRNTQDQTAQILAMTINCVPILDTATNIASTQTDQISVIIGDIPVNFAVGKSILADEHLLVPIEFFDVLGFRVRWHPQTQEIRLGPIVITLNSDEFAILTRDGERRYALDVPAQVIDEITMVPVRAILESAGYDVQWVEDMRTVIITNSD